MIYGGFHQCGTQKMVGLFHGKSQSNMDEIWGYLSFRKPPYEKTNYITILHYIYIYTLLYYILVVI